MSDEQVDRTPEGDPIRTVTTWLTFDEGEIAITADLTKFDAVMRRKGGGAPHPPGVRGP